MREMSCDECVHDDLLVFVVGVAGSWQPMV